MEYHKGMDADVIVQYMKGHIGKHISTENW